MPPESSRILPIAPYRAALLDAIDKYQTLIVVGDTGSGKTTQIPQFLLESLKEIDDSSKERQMRKSLIAITQPRRIAALSAAKRVAEETGSALGSLIGYSIRFERVWGPESRVIYMTDGTLLRTLTAESKSMKDFDIIILDEAHERSLETDILFGLLRRAQRLRPRGVGGGGGWGSDAKT